MVITLPSQRRFILSYNKLIPVALFVTALLTGRMSAQCLSSVNPVGGTNNLLVLEQQSLRIITFFRYNYGDRYYEGSSLSDFNLISSARYSYAGMILGYGLTGNITLESELGYFFNKSQIYNLDPPYTLSGMGFSSAVLSVKYGILKDYSRRFFISSSLGAKIPFTTRPQSRGGVELPVELQPTTGAFGLVWQGFMVKEQPVSGSRYFLTARIEANASNRQGYRQGTSTFLSLFYSKHLMFSWLKGDWTAIVQIRNEFRGSDRIADGWKESTGSCIFYLSPQVNYFLREKWNISLTGDIPLWQHFTGTQLATRYGISLNVARDFNFRKQENGSYAD
jgi:hypothetical protein